MAQEELLKDSEKYNMFSVRMHYEASVTKPLGYIQLRRKRLLLSFRSFQKSR